MTSPSRFDRVARLFEAACELPHEEQRAFLERECGRDRGLLEEVLGLLEEDRDPGGPLPETPPPLESEAELTPSSEFLRQLSEHQPRASRYKLVGELARGGMGAILRVWDEDLGRQLAMKVVLGQAELERTGQTPRVSERALTRFLEEAQITGQLDHPGVVPVHELGLDERGRVFFTMRLVRGLTLKQVFGLHEANQQGWTRARALEVLLKVCDAMAYAHEKGVIHRDLKPANVMVGRFGEVYVMDWGLAKSLGEGSTAAADASLPSQPVQVRTRSGSSRGTASGSPPPEHTQQGDVVGTPYYMSPEQARGDLSAVGPRSDQYAVGAILYQLLAGSPPYERVQGGPPAVIDAIRKGPPPPLARVERAASTPPELIAICERAMAREAQGRYPDVRALADDLRAFLDQRVVRAYRTGALVELRKWIQRNRAVAASLAATAVVVLGAATAVGISERRRAEVLREGYELALGARLVQELERNWVVRPEAAPDLRRWIGEAEGLLAARARELERGLAVVDEIRSTGNEAIRNLQVFVEESSEHSRGDERKLASGELDASERRRLEANIAILGAELPEFERRIDREALRAALESLSEPEANLLRLRDELPRIRARLVLAETVEARTIQERRAEWEACIASVADPDACPMYGGLELEPVLGLVPLGRNPGSGLWEFWVWLSGDEPAPDGENGWRMGPSTGMVMILVPGQPGFRMGAQKEDPGSANYDPEATYQEGPVIRVDLDPYLLSRYEMTQGQWFRLTGEWPSERIPGLGYYATTRISRSHPVERVSLVRARRELAVWGLQVPTEAQWERAARAGTDLPYSHSSAGADLEGHANLKDQILVYFGNTEDELLPWNDGFPFHSPVDAFLPNAFGFHGMHGNLSEWTRDRHCQSFAQVETKAPGTGELAPTFAYTHTVRGGNYYTGSSRARVTPRGPMLAEHQSGNVGLRPALDSLPTPNRKGPR